MKIFQMHDGYRKLRIEEHRFYVDQVRSLLLSPFSDIESLARNATEELFSHRYFDPEHDDPGAVAEVEYDYQIGFGQLLADMYERTRMSVVAGMAQEMEKKLKEWMILELHRLGRESRTSQWVWNAKWDELMALLVGLGWDPKSLPCYERLEAMMLVVNVSKHGVGKSFNHLKEKFPSLLHNVGFGGLQYHHDHLAVEDKDIEAFDSAIVAFWESVPAEIGCYGDSYDVPDGFRKAYVADVAELEKQASQQK